MSAKLAVTTSCVTLVALAAVMSVLAACSQDTRTADIAQCVAEVQRQISLGQRNDLSADNEDERHDKIGGAVADCMRKAGYGHANRDMTDGRCLEDVDFNPYCYRRG